ncbi:MAG: penicillin-binding protein 1A [Pseudomonadota bacterium]
MMRIVASIFSLASTGLLIGVLGMVGLIAVYSRDLPDGDELADYAPPLLSRVYSAEGKVIARYATENRVFVPIEEVPELIKIAFISAEDKNFYEHPGVDASGIIKAIGRFGLAKIRGETSRIAGASTITQQVMKNFLLDSDRSVERKIREAILAVRFDGTFSKDEILELYLNEIFFGARAYGISAAAQTYFGKRLDQLTIEEAAYLAGLPKEPSNLHPVRFRERAVARRNYVLRQMAENGYLDPAEAAEAIALPLVTRLDEARDAPGVQDRGLGYFTAEVRRQVVGELGREALFEGGLTVRATVDPRLQANAGRARRRGLAAYDRRQGVWRGPLTRLEDALPEADDTAAWLARLAHTDVPRDVPEWHVAVVTAVEPAAARIAIEGVPAEQADAILELDGEGWIRRREIEGERLGAPRAAADLWRVGDVVFVARDGPEGADDAAGADGGSDAEPVDWDLQQIPEVQGAFVAMDPETGRVLAIQGGFSFEFSVFNRATQAQRQPGSAFKPFVYAVALDAGYTPATIVNDAPVAVRLSNGETWRPKNSSGVAYGPTPLRRGLELSRNLMTVRIAQQVGMQRVATYAERFGVYDDMPEHLAFALGAGETTLYDMVAAYGMFVNGGRRVRPTVIDRIQDRRGSTIYRHDPRSCVGCTLAEAGAGDARLAMVGGAMQIDTSAGQVALPVLFDERDQIMNPSTAFQIVSMLQGVVDSGTATRTVGGTGLPLAGKTGTTNDSKDAWFVGFSPDLVAGCYIGFDNPRPMGRGAYGGTLCGPVFKEFMVAALEGEDPGSFEGSRDMGLVTVKLDRETGRRLPDDAEGPHVMTEVFKRGDEPVLFAEAGALAGDSILFGEDFVAGALPFSLDDDNQDSGGMVPSRGPGGTAAGGGRTPPQPPASIGPGTGGLY